MKIIFLSVLLSLFFVNVRASLNTECINGNFNECKKIMNNYGKTSNKKGAIRFFYNACTSDSLNINCEIISVPPKEALKKTMDLYSTTKASMFTMSGKNFSKIYLFTKN